MADLPSILGGMAQGFVDFGKGAVDMFGTGGAAIGDLIEGARTGKVTTKNQDDFRKWLYQTDSTKDAAAKGLGTALNGVQTVLDYIPGVNVLTRNPLGNAAQGALGGLADEFKMYGKDYDLGRAGQRAAVSGAAALAGSSLGDALKKSANPLLQSGLAQGLARGAAGGAINQGGYAAIDGGDVWDSALQGAGMGALLGGATGAMQDFRPNKVYDMPLTDEEKALRIANAQKQIDDIGPVSRFSNNPDDIAKRARITELQGTIKAYQSGYDTVQDYNDAMAAKRANRANTQSATTTQGQVYAPNMGEMEYGAPVQEGYTRLYRGITQEFDPQYNRNAMDNMNGYESWTDSYDLANRYGGGKYVYSIDVPTSQIANSIYDENPNSATYGDRNFIAAIEKAAGLDGINGNEYLLNTNDELRSGLTYNRVNTPKALGTTLADADMAVNAAREPEGFTYDYDGSDMAAVQRAYNLATQDQVKLDGMLKEISDTLGTDFKSAGQKSMESMLDKIERKVRAGRDYTVASMKDHTRGKVMMNSFSDIPRVLKELDSRGVPYETEVVTNDWGYKGYHITFRNPDGISSEIQLTTAEHWPAKLESDAIYDKWRNFDFDASTKTERQRYNEAMARSQALWAKVDFSEFDKTVQSLSDTGRALRSVAPVTSKLGLTQEPSLYTKMPSSSESANMSPSSVTRTFSGLGLDRSPNIDTPPFDNIIPQNTSRTLEGVLSADDLAVNSAKIAPGQLGLFDDMPTQTPKTGTRQTSLFDQPQEGLDYYGGDVEAPVIEPTNPYAPVNGQITQAMRDRASEIIDSLALKRQIPDNELFSRIDPSTLPRGQQEIGRILDDKYSKGLKYSDVTDMMRETVSSEFDKRLGKNPSKEDLISFIFGNADETTKKEMMDKAIGLYVAPETMSEGTLNSMARNKISDSLYGDSISAINASNRTVRGGYTGALDSALSERLGIAPGNTFKKTGPYDRKGSYGRYEEYPSSPYKNNIMVDTRSNNEDAINTMAHERLHSFQTEAKKLYDKDRYSPEVKDAYDELAKDLKDAKAYRTGKEIKERYGGDVAYWRHHDEQEARMLQQYLDAKGYTGSRHHNENQYLGLEFDDAKITPAFDKFFDKLRDLSKRGVALPALAALFGGGAYMASQENDKEKEVK